MSLYQRINSIVRALLVGLYERDDALRITFLAALARSSVFLLGPPGVAKSMIGRRIARAFSNARFFDYLMGRFSTPDELFGPVSIARLKHEDNYSRNIEGFLPTADIVFLDEIWKASSPIQNSLLGVLNERSFRNGNEVISIPLKCFIAASNEIKLNADTNAFWDRFLVRLKIAPIESDELFQDFLNGQEEAIQIPHAIEEKEWSHWIHESKQLHLSTDLLSLVTDIRASLKKRTEEDRHYYISDRRWKHIIELMKSAAFFHERSEATIIDSFLLPYCLWNDPEQNPQEIFHTMLRKWAFHEVGNPSAIHDEVSNFSEELSAATSKKENIWALEPVKYEGEYLRFIPDLPSDDREYRIWADDIEYIDEKKELECFVHRSGNFLETIVMPMKWINSDAWELSSSLGKGRIECVEAQKTRSVPVALPEAMRKELEGSYRRLVAILEDRITELERHCAILCKEAQEHLFVPQRDVSVLEAAAADKRQALEELLSNLLLTGNALDNVS